MPNDNSEIIKSKTIQDRLANLMHSAIWSDALSLVLQAGAKGIAQETLIRQIIRQNRHHQYVISLAATAHNVGENLCHEFRDVIRQDHRDRLYWRAPEPDIDSMDPSARLRIEASVSLIHVTQHTMLRLAKEQGAFSTDDVVQAVALHLQTDEHAIEERVAGIVERSSFLFAQSGYLLRVRDIRPRTREQNITMFRTLASQNKRRKP